MFSVVLCCCPCSLSPFSPLLPPAVPLGIPLDSICGRRASISEGMGDEEEDVELRRLHNSKESLEEEIEGLQVAVAEWIERLDQMSTGLVSEESLVLEVSTLRQAASDWFEETLQDSTRISELEAQKGALEVEKGQLEAELQALRVLAADSETGRINGFQPVSESMESVRAALQAEVEIVWKAVSEGNNEEILEAKIAEFEGLR